MAKIENNGITAQLSLAEVGLIKSALRFTIDNRTQFSSTDDAMHDLLNDFLTEDK